MTFDPDNLPYIETRANLEYRGDDDDLAWLQRHPSAAYFGVDDYTFQAAFPDENSANAWLSMILAEINERKQHQ